MVRWFPRILLKLAQPTIVRENNKILDIEKKSNFIAGNVKYRLKSYVKYDDDDDDDGDDNGHDDDDDDSTDMVLFLWKSSS